MVQVGAEPARHPMQTRAPDNEHSGVDVGVALDHAERELLHARVDVGWLVDDGDQVDVGGKGECAHAMSDCGLPTRQRAGHAHTHRLAEVGVCAVAHRGGIDVEVLVDLGAGGRRGARAVGEPIVHGAGHSGHPAALMIADIS